MENKNKFLEVSQIKDRSKLEVKEVDFVGDGLIAVKNKENGKIYAGVSLVCKGIGFTKDQKDRQVKNVQSDEVLKLGCVKFDAGVIDRNNEVLAIELDYLPLWLAKISLTPKMKKDQPKIVKKLVNYQLKAKDVLAEAFIKKNSLSPMDQLRLQYQVLEEHEAELREVKGEVKDLRDNLPLFNVECKELQASVRKLGIKHMGGKESNAYKDNSLRGRIYSDIQTEIKRQFQVTRYEAIKRCQLSLAYKILENYKLPMALKNAIDISNNQTAFDEVACTKSEE